MSFKYELLRCLIKAIGLKKKLFGGTAEEIVDRARKKNEKIIIPELKDESFDISIIKVMDCVVMKMIHKKKVSRANLFIIGGGMIAPPRVGSVQKALEFAKETGVDVFVPYYPLCTDYPVSKAYEMIHETYKEMLKSYKPEDISVLGSSSGGNLALGMVPYINANHLDVPMPGHIVVLSPGTCVESEEEWQRMLELDKKDFLVPAEYMKKAVDILKHGDETVPEYMIWLQKGDFTNCPRITFNYGSDETLYACAPSFERIMKKYGVKYEMTVGEGMFHCYPVFPIVKEAKEGWDLIVNIVKGK